MVRQGTRPGAPQQGPRPVHGTRFPCLDGVRAIAAFMVLVTHVSFAANLNHGEPLGRWFARMDAGVHVFFVISGFLLYRPFVAARMHGTGAPGWRAYGRNRILRIYPAYWVALLAAVLFVGGATWRPLDVVSFVTLTHIYRGSTYLGPPGNTGWGINQSWSLATEISFYLFLPLWALVLRRAGRGAATAGRVLRQETIGLGVLVAVSVAWIGVVLRSGTTRPDFYMTWLPANLATFGLGMGLAVAWSWWHREDAGEPAWATSRWLAPAAWALALLAFAIVVYGVGLPVDTLDYSAGQRAWRQLLYGVGGLLLVVPAVLGPADRGLVRGALRWKPVAWLGLVSYGVFLWQNLVLDRWFAITDARRYAHPLPSMLAPVVVGTVACAAVSWYLVERPVLRLKAPSVAGG